MSRLSAKLFVLLQRALPKILLTLIVNKIARVRIVRVKNFLIRAFVKAYNVNLDEVKQSVPGDFDSFNSFFTRELANGARPVDPARDTIGSPVDGTISAAGVIHNERIFQAKGIDYSLAELLATDTQDAATYADGSFATIYLAPYNYHRVHAPIAGRVVKISYVPGNLYSVNEATVTTLPGLFVQNERLVCHLHTDAGPAVLVFVGAMNVGSISTQWTGEIRPKKNGVVEQIGLLHGESAITFDKGGLLGWFNMGSTVILLFPPGVTMNFDDLNSGATVQVGEVLGHIVAPH
ncbi:MAG: archaetidylserine decarboxylase [Woeseiaceae bacterium]